MDSLIEALEGADVDAMRLALMLDAVVRGYSTVGAGHGPQASWVGGMVEARFPRVAAEVGRDWTDPANELAIAIDTVLAGADTTLR